MFISAVIAVIVVAGRASATGSCKFNLKTEIEPHNEPLILAVNTNKGNKEQLDFIRPQVEVQGDKTQGVISVPEDKKLLFACLGDRNAIPATGYQTAYATCSDGLLTVEGTPVSEESLSCVSGAAKSWLSDTGEQCGCGDSKGKKFQLGFMLTDEKHPNEFLPMVDICHNVDKMVSYYAAHQLYGASLLGAVKCSERKNFSPGPKSMGLFDDVDANNAYSQGGQKEALDKILGPGANKRYVSSTVYLARGHLAPDADFIYHSGQLMTYYYINVAPQWQTFNAGNWLAIENAVRELAIKENTAISVWTGTYGILKLKDNEGQDREIYLDPVEEEDGSISPEKSNIPVPEVYWKLVHHPAKKLCTVAVGHNNVFLKQPPTPICKTVNVGRPDLTSLDKGYTYFCDYTSLKKTVGYVPQVECKNIFEFPPIKTLVRKKSFRKKSSFKQ